MRFNIAAGSLGMMWIAMTIMMPLTMFMEAVNASGVLIGLVSTIRFCVMAFQIPGAFLAERLTSRKKLWAPVALAHRIVWFAAALIALTWRPDAHWMIWALIFLVGVSELLGNLVTAPWFSWMADLIPLPRSGRFWGVRQSIVTAAALAGMGLSGWILDSLKGEHGATTFGFGVVFALAAALGVADILVHLGVSEPQPVPLEPRAGFAARLLAPVRNRDFFRFTMAMGIWNFGIGLLGSFGIVYLKRDFPVTYSEIASLSIASLLGMACTSFVLGHWIDKFGARVFGAMMFVLAPLTGLAWFFITPESVGVVLPLVGLLHVPQAIVVLVIANFIGGSLFSAIGICQLRLVPALTTPHGRTMAMAVHWSLIGLLTALGPLAGGAIMDWFTQHPLQIVLPLGTPFAFYHVLIVIFIVTVWAAALPLLLSVREKEGPATRSEAPSPDPGAPQNTPESTQPASRSQTRSDK